MLDHILGRPSPRFRKYQVFSVVLFWSLYLQKADRHGPRLTRKWSKWLSTRFTVHQLFVFFCMSLYATRNFARVVGLESPEPLANLYTRDYFRATWITTALDAGFWTAMHLRPKWLRHICSIVFTVYYLACAEQADEMVRRVRGTITVQHMRISWDKSQTPILKFFTNLLRPKFMSYQPREIWIDRPAQSDYRESIHAWTYFDGSVQELKQQDKIVLDIPGGGFVAMNPRCHDDKLMAWAGGLGIPVVALDYRKAPEAPYPYGLNECYDAYYQIISTRGRCIGLSGETTPKIIISGDSAGGNLAVGTILMLLDNESLHSGWDARHRQNSLPLPEALVGIYPALEMNIGSWMSDEQLALLKTPNQRKNNKRILDRQSSEYRRLTPNTPYGSDDELENIGPVEKQPPTAEEVAAASSSRPKTRLATTSIISYVNDRVLSPEMLRSMILMYVGPVNRPDLATDYLISPLRAPEALLARFPKTFLLCGERDPLVDDTAIFAGRLRLAHAQVFKERQEMGLVPEDAEFDEKRHVEVVMVDGISHGFMQFVSVYPQGWEYIHHCSRWMRDVFDECDAAAAYGASAAASGASTPVAGGGDYFSYNTTPQHRRGSSTSGDEKPLEIPSKLRMTSINTSFHPDGAPRKRSGAARHSRGHSSGRGAIQRLASGRRSPAEARMRIQRLASSEDLLARRMDNVTLNMGDDQTPTTPYV